MTVHPETVRNLWAEVEHAQSVSKELRTQGDYLNAGIWSGRAIGMVHVLEMLGLFRDELPARPLDNGFILEP